MAERAMLHVKKGDTVVVLAGKEKGRSGKIMSVNTKKSRVLVEKIKAEIAAEILSAQIAFRDARHRWDSYRQEVQPRSAEVLQAVSFAYEKGGASLVDLLTAQRSDNEVRLATAQASAEAAAARAALQAALYAPVMTSLQGNPKSEIRNPKSD